MGLYVPQKSSNAAALLEQPGPKRVAIHMLRDVSADAFNEALADGIRANHSDADVKALEPRIKELGAIIVAGGRSEERHGDPPRLDRQPRRRCWSRASPPASRSPGEDFYRALLRVWLGDKPVQDDLKKALLRWMMRDGRWRITISATPISEAQARALRVNDTVTLHGTLYGIRDATQIHMFDRGRQARASTWPGMR